MAIVGTKTIQNSFLELAMPDLEQQHPKQSANEGTVFLLVREGQFTKEKSLH